MDSKLMKNRTIMRPHLITLFCNFYYLLLVKIIKFELCAVVPSSDVLS